MVLRRHEVQPALRTGVLAALEGRPAAIFFVAACTMLACLLEQLAADVFPDGVLTEEPDSIRLLDFDDPFTAQAAHSKDVPRDF